MLLMMFSLNLTTAFKLSISECIFLKNKKGCYCLRGYAMVMVWEEPFFAFFLAVNEQQLSVCKSVLALHLLSNQLTCSYFNAAYSTNKRTINSKWTG